MKISIITPCYNSEKYISETLQSILSQKGDFEIEHIIIDGGSTDHTLTLLDNYKKNVLAVGSTNISITIKSEADKGMYDALIKGLQLATGDIVTYLNSDDYYLPNALSVIVEIFQDSRVVNWVTGRSLHFNERGQLLGSFLPFKYCSELIRKGAYGTRLPYIHQAGTFWRKELTELIDFERLRAFRYAGDFYIWYEFSKASELNIVDAMIAGHRFHETQLSFAMDKYLSEFASIAEPRNSIDDLKIMVQRLANFTLPDQLKLKLNKNVIIYNKDSWKPQLINT